MAEASDKISQPTQESANSGQPSNVASAVAPASQTPVSISPTPNTAGGAAVNASAGFLNRKIDDSVSPYAQSKQEFAQSLGAIKPSEVAVPKENIDIYVMPKEYQHNKISGGSSKTGLLIMVIGVVLLVSSLAVIYLYFTNPDLLRSYIGISSATETTTQTTTQNPEPSVTATETEVLPELVAATSTEALPLESPKDLYIKYSQALSGLSRFQDYINLLGTYGSDLKLQKAEAQKLSNIEETAQNALLSEIKGQTPVLNGQESFSEAVDQTQAVLTITLVDASATGTIKMVLENNAWKVDEESWQKAVAVNPAPLYAVADDRDMDGLTDDEELVLSTDKDNVDSDNDGYSDGQELINLYNPAAKDQLIKSPRIKQYRKEEYLLSVLVPSQWLVDFTPQTDGGLISFTAPDNHRLLITVNKADGRSLDAYYLAVSGADQITQQQRRNGVDWSGVIGDNGLEMYVVAKDSSYVYKLSYDPSTDSTLRYPHLFNALVKSLVIK